MSVSRLLLDLDIPLNEFVSGERVQRQCNISVTTFGKMKFHTSLDVPRDQLYIFDEEDPEAIRAQQDRMRAARSVFCYGDMLELFLFALMVDTCTIFEGGPRKVIIVHNSDNPFEEHHADAFCRHPAIEAVFVQNLAARPREDILIPIPIGVANSMWKHGDIGALHRVREALIQRLKESKTTEDRPCLLYVNVRVETNLDVRTAAVKKLYENGFTKADPNLGYIAYLCALSRSRFVACPMGNGLDSHRIWESLYLGAIPVLEKSCAIYRNFASVVPLVGVDDWSQVTPSFLLSAEKLLAATLGTFTPEEALCISGKTR